MFSFDYLEFDFFDKVLQFSNLTEEIIVDLSKKTSDYLWR